MNEISYRDALNMFTTAMKIFINFVQSRIRILQLFSLSNQFLQKMSINYCSV